MLCLLFLSLVAGVQCNNWEFYLVDSSNQRIALDGLLIASRPGHLSRNVIWVIPRSRYISDPQLFVK